MSISSCICNKLLGSGETDDEPGEVAGEEARLFISGSLKSNLSSFFPKSFPNSDRLFGGGVGALERLGVFSGRSLKSSSIESMTTDGDESKSEAFFDREGTIFFKNENIEVRREDLAFEIAGPRFASAPNKNKIFEQIFSTQK